MKTRVCRRLFLPEKLLFTHTQNGNEHYQFMYISEIKNIILERSLSLVIRITLNKLPISQNVSFVPSEKRKEWKELPICATSTNNHHTSKHITPSYSPISLHFLGKQQSLHGNKIDNFHPSFTIQGCLKWLIGILLCAVFARKH